MTAPLPPVCVAVLGAALFTAPSLDASPQGSGPTVRWEVDDQGAAWIGKSVALGDHGSVLIAGRCLFDGEIAIHSTASMDPIRIHAMDDVSYLKVDAARQGTTLGAITVSDSDPFGQGTLDAMLQVWTHAHAGPADWQYQWPQPTLHSTEGLGVAISDDGMRVVAWYTDRARNLLQLRVFDQLGTPLLSIDFPNPATGMISVAQGVITPDARHLLLSISGMPHLFDLTNGQALMSWPARTKRGGLDLSEDASVVAIGDENKVEVFERNLVGGYDLAQSFSLLGKRFGGPLALDRDASHLAFAVNWHTNYERTQIRTYELATSTELWRQEISAPGNTKPLYVSAVEMDEDAASVAVSSWGDDARRTPTGFVFDDQGQAMTWIRTEGSALALDYDPAAELVAFATQDTHISGFSPGGGDIICADARDVELRVAGKPEIGQSLDLAVHGLGAQTRVAASKALGNSSTPFGDSQLDLSRVVYDTGFQPLPATGFMTQVMIPGSPALIGQALHLQAALVDASGQQGFLSNRVSLRVLP